MIWLIIISLIFALNDLRNDWCRRLSFISSRLDNDVKSHFANVRFCISIEQTQINLCTYLYVFFFYYSKVQIEIGQMKSWSFWWLTVLKCIFPIVFKLWTIIQRKIGSVLKLWLSMVAYLSYIFKNDIQFVTNITSGSSNRSK